MRGLRTGASSGENTRPSGKQPILSGTKQEQKADNARKHHKNARQNEQAYRFKQWELKRWQGLKSFWWGNIGTAYEIEHPIFVFSYQGKRQIERLNEPMPVW